MTYHVQGFVVLLLGLLAVTTARPSFAPLGGLYRLRAHSTAFLEVDGVHRDKFTFAHGEDTIMLKYEARKTTKELVVHLDEELGLDSVKCTPDMEMLLHFTSPEGAKDMHRRMEDRDVLLVGGIEWLCVDESQFPQIILRRVEAATIVGEGARMILHTSAAEHKDFFEDLNLSFSTTKLPPAQSVKASDSRMEMNRIQVLTKELSQVSNDALLGGFLGDIWSAIKTVGKAVQAVVLATVTAVDFLATGDLSLDKSCNFSYQKWGSQGSSFHIAQTLPCSNCSGRLDVGLQFRLAIEKYHLRDILLVTEGNVEFNIGVGVAFNQSYHNDGKTPITTLKYGPMSFTVGGVPFMIYITVPIDMLWNIQAQAKATLVGSIYTQGSIRYGLQYENGRRIPINQHTYFQKGNFDEVDLDIKADVTVGLQIVPIVQVNYIGYIDFSINPFVEISLDYNLNTGCNGYGGLRAVMNWGLRATVGCNITISIIGFYWNISSMALCDIKKPISSGCFKFPMRISDSSTHGASAIALTSSPLMVGNTWHGWQRASLKCKSGIQYYDANVTFQLIDYTQGSTLFYFVVAYSYVMPDKSWCVQQALYDGAVYGGDVILTPLVDNAPYPVFYSKCQNVTYEGKILANLNNRISGKISNNNWDQILVESSDKCVTVTMSRFDE